MILLSLKHIHKRTYTFTSGVVGGFIADGDMRARTYTHLTIVERFGADGNAPQVDRLLEPGRDPQSLQLLICVARELEPAQVLRLFGHRVQSGYLASNKVMVKTCTR